MPSLLEKIAASAAERLAMPPGRSPADELARFKRFIKVESHRLKILHRAGAGGLQICRARAGMMDLLLRAIFEQVRRNLPSSGTLRPVSVIALGGYGRGELNPRSDIDIMLLHDGDSLATTRGRGDAFLRALTEPGGLLYTLFDIDLKVGYSVRNVEDCVRAANADMQSKTSLIEARLVAGDTELFKRMQIVVLARCVRGYEDAYIAARLQDQQERRAKFGNSACMQEPNIKNGCGGLRDAQNLIWMAFFKYRIRSLVELEHREQLSSTERRQIEAAYDFLLRVRNELHYSAERPVDQLARSLQPTVAHHLGYTDRSPVRRISAFMRDLYTHLRHVDIITRDLEQRLALVAQPRRLPRFRDLLRGRRTQAGQQLVDGFRLVDGELHPGSNRVFRDQPRRLMRAFLLAQQRGLRLHPDLTQLMRNQLEVFKRAMLNDPHVQETFLEILGQRGNVARILRTMHEVGLLGKFLPEFGHLTCLVQHEFYHQYAADEHTLVCLEKLDELWESEKPEFKPYADLFRTVERPFVLYLALLLHDTGKAPHKGAHTEAGARLATQVARRFRLDGATAHQLSLIIEHHLLLVQVSQRRDLEDRAVIRGVAAAVQSRENLDLLTLHTLADSRGTADNLWNGFKDSLLWTLHRKTTEFLAGGTEFIRAEARQRELLLQEVAGLLPPTFSPEEIQAHFAHLPPRYFQIHSAREIAADLTRVHRFMHFQVAMEDRALEPVVTWHNEPDRGYASVNVCTWDRAGLFSKISGSLTAAGLNILSAQIFSRTDGIILDTFFVADARTGLLPGREERERFEKIFAACLTGEVDLAGLIARRRTGRPLYQGYELEPLPTRIAFDNETSEGYTIIDLETEDRVGLLYAVSQAFAALGVDIALAKVSTEKGAAVDSFYVSELDGARILAPGRQATIAAHLRAALAALDR